MDDKKDDSANTTLQISNRNGNPNHIYLWNESTKKYDVIDKATGKMITARTKSDIAFLGAEYSFEVGEIVCDLLRSGKTMKAIGEMENMPSASAISFWRRNFADFRKKSDEAMKDRGHYYHDQLVHLVDKEASSIDKDHVPFMKLKADTYKWAAERADPERFGQKKQELQLVTPSVIVLDTGIDNSKAPDLDELLGRKEIKPAQTIDAEFTNISEDKNVEAE